MDTYLIVLGLISLFIIIVWNPISNKYLYITSFKSIVQFCFEVEASKKVTVEVKSQTTKKPIVEKTLSEPPSTVPIDNEDDSVNENKES